MFAQLSQVSRKNMYKQQLNQVNLSYLTNKTGIVTIL